MMLSHLSPTHVVTSPPPFSQVAVESPSFRAWMQRKSPNTTAEQVVPAVRRAVRFR